MFSGAIVSVSGTFDWKILSVRRTVLPEAAEVITATMTKIRNDFFISLYFGFTLQSYSGFAA